MPSASVGINLSGIIDYFRQSKDLGLFKQMRPQVYEGMRTALKAGDTDGADQVLHQARMQFLQDGGSDDGADRLFKHMDQALVQKKAQNLIERKMLLDSGAIEATGTPGNIKFQPRQGLMERVMGGGQPQTGQVPTVQSGGTLLPSQSSPTATAPMPPMPLAPSPGVVRSPLQEQSLGGTEQPAPSIGAASTAGGPPPTDWQSMTSTPAGRKELMQKLATAALSGSKRDREEAENAMKLLSGLNEKGKKSRRIGTPQTMYNRLTGKMEAVYPTIDEDAGTVTYNQDLGNMSKDAPKQPTTTLGDLYTTPEGKLVRRKIRKDAEGNETESYASMPPGLNRPGDKPTLAEEVIRQRERLGIPTSPAQQQQLERDLGKVGQKQVEILQGQKKSLERKIDVMLKDAQLSSVLQNGLEGASPDEKRKHAEYKKTAEEITQIDVKIKKLFSALDAPEPPQSSAPIHPLAPPPTEGTSTSGAAGQSPGMVPLTSPSPRTRPAALNWAERALGR